MRNEVHTGFQPPPLRFSERRHGQPKMNAWSLASPIELSDFILPMVAGNRCHLRENAPGTGVSGFRLRTMQGRDATV